MKGTEHSAWPGASWRGLRGMPATLALAATAACGVTPLTNKLAPGEEPFLIVVGEGPDGQTDLFAASSAGGRFFRLTFTRPLEMLPALSPAGTSVAFARTVSAADTTAWELVVMDLLAPRERAVPLPRDAGSPAGLGWSRSGARVYVRAAALYGADAILQELEPVSTVELPAADSATRQLLGEPAFAAVAACGPAVCAVPPARDTTRFDPRVRSAFRWGSDSVGLLRDEGIEIRPLGSGRTRLPNWTGAPRGMRWPAHHPGVGKDSPSR